MTTGASPTPCAAGGACPRLISERARAGGGSSVSELERVARGAGSSRMPLWCQGIRLNSVWHYHPFITPALPPITTHYHPLPPIATHYPPTLPTHTHCHPLPTHYHYHLAGFRG
jgi:hypothetical protein